MQFLEQDDVLLMFDLISEFLDGEPVPNYKDEKKGLDNYRSILDMSKLDYYPTLADKASYIFVSIVTGHKFSNGNKRLGVMTLWVFLIKNKKKRTKEFSLDEIMNILNNLFGKKVISDVLKKQNEDPKSWNPPVSLAYFIVPLIVADSETYPFSFDVLKDKITIFLKQIYDI